MTWPSRIELKACSNWTLWPWFTRTQSTHKTKRFWLVHLPFCDLWVHFEQEAHPLGRHPAIKFGACCCAVQHDGPCQSDRVAQ